MLNLLSRFIEALQNFIEQATGQTKDTDNPGNQPQILRKTFFRKKTRTSSQKTPPPTLQQRIQKNITDRWQWIRRNLWLVGGITILLGVVYFSERGEGDPWWLNQGQTIESLGTWLTQIWAEYQISIIVISIALVLFLFGYDWLVNIYKWLRQRFRNIWRWGRAHILISLPLTFILILLVGYTITNINTWVFSSVEVWSEESLGYTSQAIAIQFRGNLNAIGAAPFDSVTRLTPASPPVVAGAKRSVTPLEFDEHCPEIMLGPQSFSQVGEPISLSRSSAVSNEGTGGGEISLNTTVGTFNLPLEGLIRFLLRNTPNYTEFSAQIIPADRSTTTETIRIVVNANDGRSWSVEGRQKELSQLINYLAHRLILDLQDNPSNEPLSEAELALALGHQAYAAGVYDAALAYYRLAERFQPQDNDLQIMLGLIQYYLSTRTSGNTQKEYQEGAEQAFDRVDIQSAESNVIDLYPYLACFHNQLGHTDQANDYLNHFNAALDPETPAAKAQRIAELKNKPALSTGRILVKSPPTGSDNTYHLYYISNNAISYALNQPYNTAQLTVTVRTLDETPHQIFVVNEMVFYITADGLVNFFTPDNPDQTSTIFGVDDLQFNDRTEYTGGIRQIIVADENILMVDQFGRMLRLRDEGNGRWPLEQFAEIDARQIVLDSNTTLYVLKEDGTVWRINDPIISDLKPDRQVVFDTDNREIAVANGVIYALRANGNIWRYIDGESADTGLLIDQGVQTRRIMLESQGLFVLKNSGDVWLIRNPQQPNQDDIVQLDLPNAERVAIAIAGVNLIALERNGQASLEPKIYQPRQLSNDDDGDGLTNVQESELGTEPDNPDTDRDGLTDGEEVKIYETDPLNPDTDEDALRDGVEVKSLGLNPLSPDTDADGLLDGDEVARQTDPLNPDTDGDGLTDSEEVRSRLDPTTPDTDGDGTPDAEDANPLQSPPTATPTFTATPTPSPTIEPNLTITPTVTPTPVQTSSVRAIDDAEEVLINVDPQDNSTWFWLDRTEVTNRQYNLCFESDNCTQNVQNYGNLFYEDDHPVVGVNWQQAQSYCQWVGGRLPTAAEWRSATAPTGQTYLWGDDDLTCDQAVISGCDDGQPEGTRPVDSRLTANNAFGLVDMFGNVWEWTSTLDTNENRRRVAGGSWSNPDDTPQGNFDAFDPLGENALALDDGGSGDENEHSSNNIGFRCARDYQPESP